MKGKKTGGRQKGTPNKVTATVRQSFTEAFHHVNQGPSSLAQWGRANPDKFYPLAAKLIPIDVTSNGETIRGVIALPPEVDP